MLLPMSLENWKSKKIIASYDLELARLIHAFKNVKPLVFSQKIHVNNY